ncbi:SDR family NAD(P)-dependent oxidoreductase [Mesobacillus subterraneus]|uniref:SDR family NAD(P)-dependent oxidoreductase n=1 Tax=Mesobacillus subterraneus TaxID=285983 RepID=UPI00273D1D0C|nr:SDR family NAD(P)-dependent oxidoreductase [Mesobacillus subterraneus]WLR57142.1 SDR family NAD(P)-dependent oxidoreductase [Mesobacillus subterraneus]
MRFAETVVLVTGAGSGIGKAAAFRFASEGAKVILVGRTKSKLESAAQEINDFHKLPREEIFSADVTDEEDVRELAHYMEEQFGELHVLVNNAGGSVHSKIMDTSASDWDFVQNTNLKSVFLVSKMLGKLMADSAEREGNFPQNRSIVNVASLSGHQAGAHIPHYSAAKAGVINFTKALALELASFGIRVNSVSPGFVETPLTEQGMKNEQFVKAIRKNTALKRAGNPDEIADVIAFAASHEASYMTGSDILVDGGWMIK